MPDAPVTYWVPYHLLTDFCWCRPRRDGGVVMHRRLPVRPDREPRAFVLLTDGVPA